MNRVKTGRRQWAFLNNAIRLYKNKTKQWKYHMTPATTGKQGSHCLIKGD